MDIAAIASAGVPGALVLVIIYLLSGMRADRKQYEELVNKADARADAAEVRLAAANAQLDAAHQARRTAEDRAIELARYKALPPGGGP